MDLATVFIIAVSIAFALVYAPWFFSRARSLLTKWVVENGYELLHSELRHFFKGPFFWAAGRGHVVYRVKIRDETGEERTAWVRFGGGFAGILNDKTTVKWD